MLPRSVILILLLALLGAACAGSVPITTDPETTSSTTVEPEQSIVFGSGSVPETMPEEFPIPARAIVGSTLIDHDRGRTEMMVRVSADVEALVAFFDTNLPGRGFAVGTSVEDGAGWRMGFSAETGVGTIEITSAGQGVTQAFVVFTSSA